MLLLLPPAWLTSMSLCASLTALPADANNTLIEQCICIVLYEQEAEIHSTLVSVSIQSDSVDNILQLQYCGWSYFGNYRWLYVPEITGYIFGSGKLTVLDNKPQNELHTWTRRHYKYNNLLKSWEIQTPGRPYTRHDFRPSSLISSASWTHSHVYRWWWSDAHTYIGQRR